MAQSQLTDTELLEKLKASPLLRGRIESLLLAVENEQGDLKEADAAELRIIDEMRQMGRESLKSWAEHRAQVCTEEALKSERTRRDGKKNSTGTAPLETST